MTLGSVIAERRKNAGFSQRELARRCDIDNTTISRIERDEDDLTCTPKTLKAIADALELDYSYLLALNGTIEDDRMMRLIARGLKCMSAEERSRLMMMLRDNFSVFALLLDDSDLFSGGMRGEE